jgi:adenylate cyclase
MPVGAPAAPEAGEEGTLMLGMGTLQVEGDAAREYALGPRTTIGRIQDNSICLAFSNVSRHHAVIELGDSGFTVKDLKSGNGTFVNDERVRERALADGDRIQIGDTVLVFRAPQ